MPKIPFFNFFLSRAVVTESICFSFTSKDEKSIKETEIYRLLCEHTVHLIYYLLINYYLILLLKYYYLILKSSLYQCVNVQYGRLVNLSREMILADI